MSASLTIRDMLGERFQGRETDWEGALADVETVRSLREAWQGDPTSLRGYIAAAEGRRFQGDEATLLELTTVEADGKRRSALASAQRRILSVP